MPEVFRPVNPRRLGRHSLRYTSPPMRLRTATICLTLALFLASLASCTMPTHEEQTAANEKYLQTEGIAALQPGHPAPDLAGLGLQQASGAPVSLADLTAEHPAGVLLFVFPALETPNSQRNLLDWQQRSARLAGQGLGVVAVAPGELAAAQGWLEQIGCTLPLLSDPRGDAARALGCLSVSGSFPQRTTIGIAPDGTVKLFYRGQADEKSINAAFGLAEKK